MRSILFIIAAALAFGQADVRRTIIPGQANTDTGILGFRELNGSGNHEFQISAQTAMAATIRARWPNALPLTNGECIKSTTAGVLSFGACGGSGGHIVASEYDWIQTITAPGAPGTYTITLTPGPLGVVATDTVSYYWMIGTAGASERVKSTGTGTCNGTGQASCTVQVITANSHTGTTTIQSGTAGAQEATNYTPGSSIALYYPKTAACISWYTEYNTVGKNVSIIGDGYSNPGTGSCIGLVGSTTQRGIVRTTVGSINVRGMTIGGAVSTIGVYVGPQLTGFGISDIIDGNWFNSHGQAVVHRSVDNVRIMNNLLYCWDVCIEWGNEYWGDQGAGSFFNNIFVNLASGGTTKAFHIHAAAATYIHGNSFLGMHDSIYIDGRMAVVNTSGTTVTATSDFTFSTLVTTGVQVFINGVAYTISTRDSSTQLTLTGSAGTQSGVDFGIPITQIRINDNNFDNQERTGVHVAGTVTIGDIQIDSNRFQRVTSTEDYWAIKATNPNTSELAITNNRFGDIAIGTTNTMTGIYANYIGRNFIATNNTFATMKYGITLDLSAPVSNNQTGVISGNMFDTKNYMSVARAIYLKNISGFSLTGNNLQNVNTGIVIDGSSSNNIQINATTAFCNGASPSTIVSVLAGSAGINVDGVVGTSACGYGVLVNAAVTANATTVRNVAISGGAYLANVSAGVSTLIEDSQGVTFATLPANSKNGTLVFCSDCKAAATAVCATGGSGAYASRLNGAWNCAMSNNGQWIVDGANIYYPSTGNVGVGLTPGGSFRFVVGGGAGSNAIAIAHGVASSNLILDVQSTYSLMGTYAATDLVFATDSTGRWRITPAGILRPETHDTYDIGLTGTRVRTVYATAGEFYKAGGTSASDYVTARKINVWDSTGSSGGWDLTAITTGSASSLLIRDNAGVNVINFVRKLATFATDYADVYVDLYPDVHNGQSLGKVAQHWAQAHITDIYTSGGKFHGHIDPPTNDLYRIGGSSTRYAEMWTVDLNAVGGPITLLPGAAPAIGDVWTASTTGGVGGWATPSAGGLPVVDTTGIAKGSADATKIVRFEVDGFTTATTRVLTPQNADYTIAGTNLSQTFTNTQTFSGVFQATGTGGATGVNADFIPISNDTLLLGTASYRWAQVSVMNINIGAGGDVTGDLIPDTANTYNVGIASKYWNTMRANTITTHGGNISPATTLTGELGSSTLVWNKLWTNNLSIDGTVTAPDNNSGVSATKTVRASGGLADCTLIFSGGILTGGTC